MLGPHSTRIIVTCGPAIEPIDQVRCITNSSTGELGSLLSDHLAAHDWKVFCLRGRGATFPPPLHARVLPFSTNADLEELLHQLAFSTFHITAIFHAAALCDFRLIRIENHQRKKIYSPKLNSQSGEVRLILAPAPKIIRTLKAWFPQSRIVGWKYELTGLPSDALAKGRQQISENMTDACIINGNAWERNFAFIEKKSMGLPPTVIPTKSQLCAYLNQWLTTQLETPTPHYDTVHKVGFNRILNSHMDPNV